MLLTQTAVTGQEADKVEDKKTNQLFAESVHILGGNRNPVLRWYDSVKFAVVAESEEKVSQLVTSIINEISLLTGVKFKRVNHSIDHAEDYLAAVVESPPMI